jgi:hypothetical protein
VPHAPAQILGLVGNSGLPSSLVKRREFFIEESNKRGGREKRRKVGGVKWKVRESLYNLLHNILVKDRI